ncbi:MAG: PH domain-containing protein, partial [Ancrocorticia sp.]|nr:PH domain-containing protein [Ancrocorticia sp.]
MDSPRYILRNRSQVLKGILLIIFGAVLVVVTAFDPVEASYLPPGLAALGLVGIASSVFILPRVVVSPAGIETRNWLFRGAGPWNHYREREPKFGRYLVSTDTKDVV